MRFLEWLSTRRAPQTIHISTPVSVPLYATVHVGAHNLPPRITADLAVAALKTALAARSGAQWVTVQHSSAGNRETVEVQSTGTPGPESEAIHAWLEAFVVATLENLEDHSTTDGRPLDKQPDESIASVADAPSDAATAALKRDVILAEAAAAEAMAAPAVLGTHVVEEDLRALNDAELLGRLLGHVSLLGGAELAVQAMQHFGSFAALLTAPEMEVMGLPGFGTRLTAAVKLTYAAALRLSHPAQPFLGGAMARIAYLSQESGQEDADQLRILYLDAAGRLRADEVLLDAHAAWDPAFPRRVVMRALELKAKSIVLVYVLLGGLVSPPEQQMRLIAMTRDAAEALGLVVKVHITIENGHWQQIPDNRYLQA
jgi:DNA repair protein RadC